MNLRTSNLEVLRHVVWGRCTPNMQQQSLLSDFSHAFARLAVAEWLTAPGLSSSAKSLVQLGNTFTQSGCGCLKKCLQLSKLLPLPSHKLHTFPKIHKNKNKSAAILIPGFNSLDDHRFYHINFLLNLAY